LCRLSGKGKKIGERRVFSRLARCPSQDCKQKDPVPRLSFFPCSPLQGFGSLDAQSRQQAIEVLGELAGDSRMVGIISHVTELKEQIDRKLVVSRTDKGSRAVWTE